MKKNKNKKMALTGTIVVVVLIVACFVLFFAFKNESIEEKYLKEQMTWVKCISMCPVIQSEGAVKTNFEDSCYYDCKQYQYKGDIVKELNKKQLDSVDEILAPSTDCFISMSQDSKFDYMSCFESFFKDNDGVIDLSDFKHENYTIYEPEIVNLECFNDKAEITTKMTSGRDDLKIAFIFIEEVCNSGVCQTGYSRISDEYDAPNIGETKSYLVDYTKDEIIKYNQEKRKFDFYNITYVKVLLRESGEEKASERTIGDFDIQRC